MKRIGIEGIYLGGWATSAKGSRDEDPGPDLASYPLSQVPDEAAGLVRALLTADRNQRFARSRMTRGAARRRRPRSTSGRSSSPTPTPATAATPTCATWSAASSRSACPGYHIEDQKPGRQEVRPPGRQGARAPRTSRSSASTPPASSSTSWACRASSWPAPTPRRPPCSTAAATSATSRSSWAPPTARCRPTRPASWRSCAASTTPASTEVNGHLLYALSEEEYAAADAWLERSGRRRGDRRGRARAPRAPAGRRPRRRSTPSSDRFLDAWQAEAGLKTYGAGGRRGDGLPRRRGRDAADDRSRSGSTFADTRVVVHGPREGARRWASTSSGTASWRADARGLLPDPGRHRLRDRQVAGGGAVRRPALDGDQDRRPRRRAASSPRRSTPCTPTRCWPTTCRRRSTGTRPG